MEAKDLFARILSSEDMQAVVNCSHLPVITVNEQECKSAYRELSATKRCILRRRVTRYADASASVKTPMAQEQFKMFSAIKQAIL